MLTWLLATCSEVIDAMYAPSRYDHVYPFSYLYTYFVSVPHSILIQLASPTANKTYGECSVGSTLIYTQASALQLTLSSWTGSCMFPVSMAVLCSNTHELITQPLSKGSS